MEIQPRRSSRLAAKMSDTASFPSRTLIVVLRPKPTTTQETMASQNPAQPDFDAMAVGFGRMTQGLVEVSAGLADVSTNAQLVRNVPAVDTATQIAEIKETIQRMENNMNKRFDDMATKNKEAIEGLQTDMGKRFDDVEASVVVRYVSSLLLVLSLLYPPLFANP